ncbi:MAG: CPXCG motif-containing cysteine-rich protein [Candidatus Competibacteraceae bacterium]|jgi:hypothetical protein|nr:CPXCG motif-containing cysteine-rich protein [Candidatus Competibacteraceae bacterium]
MNGLETVSVDCPYCGELIELVVDCSLIEQNYIEDCEVCCRPIALTVHVDEDGAVTVSARSEDDS